MTTIDALQALVFRQQIHDVLVRYCVALDRMDLDELASLFTENCRVSYGPDERLNSNGANGLKQSLERMWRWARTSHHLTNVRIDFDGAEEADVTSYVIAWHERPDGSDATVYGQYRDRFVRRDGRWLIAARTMLMNGSDAGFTLELHRLDRREAPADWAAPDIDDIGGR